MPLIEPPEEYRLPSIKSETVTISKERAEWIKKFWDVKDWYCPVCKLRNFGHNKKCANWKCKTPRPSDFIL